ncbi:MAG: NAD(P)-dependent oxidoreductase [Acidobacteriota bacterium]|nr:NAD(P)-dependent oxidoreductase [Acidobacteriota bacterium]
MKIVVTGATGLVGWTLIPLLHDRHEVWAVGRDRAGARLSAPNVHWIAANLAAPELPRELPATADVVVHLAQSPHYRDFPSQALDIFNVNVASTARLLDWSRTAGVRQFILASTGAVASAGAPAFYYVASKQSAELLATSYETCFGVLIVRFFFVYGHGQRASMLVPRLIDIIRTDGSVSLAGAAGPRLNPVHVDDAAQALMRAMELATTGRINVAGPDVLTIRAMSDCIAARAGWTPRFESDAAQTAQDLVGDISRMSELLGPPRVSFADGIDRMMSAMEREGAE